MKNKLLRNKVMISAGIIFALSCGITAYNSINDFNTAIPLTMLIISWVVTMTGLFVVDYDNTPINEKTLGRLTSFGREKDGNFSDWCDYSIMKETNKQGSTERWTFCLFNEVDGSTTFVRYVDNMEQLKNVYKGVTDKKLI